MKLFCNEEVIKKILSTKSIEFASFLSFELLIMCIDNFRFKKLNISFGVYYMKQLCLLKK